MQKIEWMDKLEIGDEVVEVDRGIKTIRTVTGVTKKSIFIDYQQYSKFTSFTTTSKYTKRTLFDGAYHFKNRFSHLIEITDEVSKEIQKERESLIEFIKNANFDVVPTRELKWIAGQLNNYILANKIRSKRES